MSRGTPHQIPGTGRSGAPESPLSFLLLEDSEFDAELLQSSLLKRWPGSRLTWVSEGASFVRALQQRCFDVVLSDYQVPGYSGLEALDDAQRVLPEIPFIFVSGVIGEDNAVELLKRGATDYVIKGRFDRLPLVVERALRESDSARARRAAEQRLADAGALYARVVDSLNDHAVVVLDAGLLVRRWNRAAAELFDLDAAFDGTLPATRLLADPAGRDDDGFPQLFARARADGSSSDGRWLTRRDGRRWRSEISVSRLASAQGEHTGYTLIVRDVTAAWQVSEALQRAKEDAERANALKDEFLAVLSHELRSPLSAIMGWSEILVRKGGEDPVLVKAGTVILRSARAQERLIDDLLALTSVSAGKMLLHRRPTDLVGLVSQVVLAHLHQAQEKGVALMLERDHPETVLVDVDPQRLTQVVTNLIVNAVKFTGPAGRIAVAVRVDDGHAVLSVTDTGRGISAAFLPHVFDRLRQEDGSPSRSAGGLGLGLTIAQALVALHGGEISAASDGPGRGATFVVRLPCLVDGVAVSEVVDAMDEVSLPAELQGARVLLVDDEVDAREVGQIALASLGARVTVADGAAQALALLRGGRFDVLVSDVAMPGIDGLALMRKVRQLSHCSEAMLPAVALTAMALTSDRQAGLQAGFQAYVPKPIALRDLARGIRDAHAASQRAGRSQAVPPAG